MTLLNPGDQFPTLTVALPGGDTLSLPDALAGGFGVVLFYRGAWCPYCNAQLRAFQRASESLAEVGAKVVALSVDDEATTGELVAKHGLTFPVGHSADARAVSAGDGRVRRPRAWVPPIDRVRAQPDGRGGGQRLLQRGHRPPGARRRRRPDPLPPRSRQRLGLRGRGHDRRRHQLLLRPGLPVRLDDQQMGAPGHRPAGLHRRLAVHLAAHDQRGGRLRQPLPARLRRPVTPPGSSCCGWRPGSERSTAREGRTAVRGDRDPGLRHRARRAPRTGAAGRSSNRS